MKIEKNNSCKCHSREGGNLPLVLRSLGHVMIASLVMLLFASCSDFGDRDNPLDPGASNYVIDDDDSESSSSCSARSSSSSSKKASSSSKKAESSSSSTQSSSSSEKSSDLRSSSSVIPASSGNIPSSSSEESSSSTKQSSSSNEQSSSNSKQSSSSNEQSSSSSEQISSSSDESSSSSENSWLCGESMVTRGDREYKTVVIKEQCWTKENLRYVPSTGNTMCYGNDDSNCDKYGRLYDYEAASLACPTGWRLPTSAEYDALAEYSMEGATLYDAGAHFKATEGWISENGDDFLEFTALPGGKCNEEKTCLNIGKMGYWWTSTEKVKNTSHLALSLNGDGDSYSATAKMDNDQYISVRCVKK